MHRWWLIFCVACGAAPQEPAAPPSPPPAPPVEAPAEPAASPEDDAGAEASAAATTDAPIADQQHSLAARHILITFKGAVRSRESRTREEALALAEDTSRLLQGGADFLALARERSEDATTKDKGGFLGAFSPGAMVPEFEAALNQLQVGQTSGPVESAYGFHLIRREEVREFQVGHIFVALLPAESHAQPRTPAEAHARAAAALDRLDRGEDFEAVARVYSDGTAGRWGGEIGWIQQGLYPPELDAPLFALKPGQHTAVIDSRLGSHVFYRFK